MSSLGNATADAGASCASSQAPGRSTWWRYWLAILLAVCLLTPGCGGCTTVEEDPEVAEERAKEEAEKEKAKQKEKPKPDFEDPRLYVQPSMPQADRIVLVKPGHWTMLTSEMKANNFDYVGELHAHVTDERGNPWELESTPYSLATVRSAPLPKGQQKFLDYMVFLPRGESKRPRLAIELRNPRGGLTQSYLESPTRMPPHCYYFLVLSAQPEAFQRLARSEKTFDSIRAPGDEGDVIHYRVAAPRVKNRAPLPVNALAWSSIAYILWDEVEPDVLDADQRQAMLDWLHWGGQLIVSGPGTLDKLRGSFLDPSKELSYLPALPGESIKLSPEQVAAIAQPWVTPGKNGLAGRSLVVARNWAAVELKKHPEARFVENTQNQVAERQIGRGRIVVTSFRIGQPSLLNWPSFDCFLNAVLLRRPPREFKVLGVQSLEGVAMRWVQPDGTPSADILDPRLTTTLRYFTRDINDKGEIKVDGRVSDVVATTAMTPRGPVVFEDTSEPDAEFAVAGQTQGSGVGGWNDFEGAPRAARDSLREAAGIKIPDATFVVFVLAVYLAVLVPLNWGIFRVVGRIELAWVAAPLIAIVGALSVIKLAELDIGFARSKTEISVLETHNNYPRGHLTRYTALYASLSTTYDLVFDDKNAVALPFPADENFQRLRGQGIDRVEFRRDETEARLAGFNVDSNSTGMVHSEQMYELGGAISYTQKDGRYEIFNRTKYGLHNAGVIRRVSKEKVEVAWLGDLPAGQGRAATFVTAPRRRPLLTQWNLANSVEEDRPLQRLLDLAQQTNELEVGEVRLLAIVREQLGGLSVEPEPSQNEISPTLVIAHLRRTTLAQNPPKPDKNSRATFKGEYLDEEGEIE